MKPCVYSIEFHPNIDSPNISHQQLLGLVTEIVGDQISNTGMNFIKVLISANRLIYVSNILELFEIFI